MCLSVSVIKSVFEKTARAVSLNYYMTTSMNSSEFYSCYEGIGLSSNSTSLEFWDVEGESDVHKAALVSAAFTLVLIIIGVPSNTLILSSILWQRLYKEPTYILLLNLSIANLLMCIVVMPFTVISGFAGGFVFGGDDLTRCKVCQTGVVLTALALFSLHILTLLSVDRFLFVRYPFKYDCLLSNKVVIGITLGLWIFCFGIALCPLFGFGAVDYGRTISTCKIKFYGRTGSTDNVNYAILLAVEFLLIPLPILFFTNVYLIWTVQKHLRKLYSTKKEIGCNQEEFVSIILKKFEKSKLKKQLQLARLFGGIMMAHLFTWVPVVIYVFQAGVTGSEEFPIAERVFVYICLIFFPVLHPVIEAWLLPEARNILVNVLSTLFRKCLPKCYSHSDGRSMSKFSQNSLCSFNCKLKYFIDLLCIATLPLDNQTDDISHQSTYV